MGICCRCHKLTYFDNTACLKKKKNKKNAACKKNR